MTYNLQCAAASALRRMLTGSICLFRSKSAFVMKGTFPPELTYRAGNSLQQFRRRERAMLRFRSMRNLQKFASLHRQVHNHFSQERTRISRRNFAPRTFGSRIDAPPRWLHGVNSARPEQGRVRAISETVLFRLTAPAITFN